MKALYFRLMYENIKNGVIHNVSILNTEKNEEWNGCYLCAGGKSEDRIVIDERFQEYSKPINLMVLGSIKESVVQAAVKILAGNQVLEIVMPEETVGIKERLQEAGAKEITVLSNGESAFREEVGWKTKIRAYGTGEEAVVVMYHDVQEISPKEKEGMLMVKVASKERECEACISDDDHRCAMKCCLYNDYALCKGHNESNSQEYLTGTLLLGNLNLEKYGTELKEDFMKNQRVRFCSFTGTREGDFNSTEIFDWMDTGEEKVNQYFVVPAAEAENCSGMILELLKRGPRHQVVLTEEKHGVCATGFFKERV